MHVIPSDVIVLYYITGSLMILVPYTQAMHVGYLYIVGSHDL